MLRPTDLGPVSSPQGCSSKTYEKKALESEMLSRAFFCLAGTSGVGDFGSEKNI
jgi:hypothetical protein